MNNSCLDNTGVLPNYLNTSSSDSKYSFAFNTTVEFNKFLLLKNNSIVFYENPKPNFDEVKTTVKARNGA